MTPEENSTVIRFIDRLKEDESFRNSFTKETDPAVITSRLKEEGYDFTYPEFLSTLKALRPENPSELSEAEMATIAGGKNILQDLKDDYMNFKPTKNPVVDHCLYNVWTCMRVIFQHQ